MIIEFPGAWSTRHSHGTGVQEIWPVHLRGAKASNQAPQVGGIDPELLLHLAIHDVSSRGIKLLAGVPNVRWNRN